MGLDDRNLNTLWSSVLVETLVRCGLKSAIVCPGSRSAPLTVAFAQHPAIDAIPVLDERSASFFALGLAKQTHRPVALVCTSGTAGANFYPAVIEARESRVPLLVLTADRPPELRDCNAGQAIDQQKLYGDFVNYYCELAIPELNLNLLQYLRQRIAQCYQQCMYPLAGAVHINIPLRDPLAPIDDPEVAVWRDRIPLNFFDHLQPIQTSVIQPTNSTIEFCERGVIIAGIAQAEDPEAYVKAIAMLSKHSGFPVLAEALSPVRHFAHLCSSISTYDSILRQATLAQALRPEQVIRIGEMPTSKALRQWLSEMQPETWIIDENDRSLDSLHGSTRNILSSVQTFVRTLNLPIDQSLNSTQLQYSSSYFQAWLEADLRTRNAIDQTLSQESNFFEGKVAWLLAQILPPKTPIFISNSMPVRDAEYFWQPSDRQFRPFVNRGANGIDGSLSTAVGIAHQNHPTVMLTGDLALLHDTNGFLLRSHFKGHLTIVLLNNNGGGIFGMLPIAQFDPPFDEFFSTPQHIDFAQLCQTYGIEHEVMPSWEQLSQRLESLPESGIRVLEVRCDRRFDAAWRKEKLPQFAIED